MRGGADEALTPKYAHVERERRWLVDPALRPDLSGIMPVLIEDRYITGTRLRLRRMTDSASGQQVLKLTKKYDVADPLARPIVTAYLSDAEYAVFEALPASALAKNRFALPGKPKGLSIDRFLGALSGLELAEIEWPDDAGLRALKTPVWASREVSNDPCFQGGHLATHGLPKDLNISTGGERAIPEA